MYDCIIVGGGPAGLTAAIYLARFHLDVLVLHDGKSRAATIPLTRNHAGFPGGIAGSELVERMRIQACEYGSVVRLSEVISLGRDNIGFTVESAEGVFQAKSVLLATGVVNQRPDMPSDAHDIAVAKGLIRYCPICDGYEVTDKSVGVLGSGERGFSEAMFMRSFTSRVSLIAKDGSHDLSDEKVKLLKARGISLKDGPITGIQFNDESITVAIPSGSSTYASIYPALGSDVRSGLVARLGAKTTDAGCVEVDRHQRTSVPGLYAAGDVVLGLDQISHAMGQASVAATAIRNDLSERNVILRA